MPFNEAPLERKTTDSRISKFNRVGHGLLVSRDSCDLGGLTACEQAVAHDLKKPR
jgi:hypothetical protein